MQAVQTVAPQTLLRSDLKREAEFAQFLDRCLYRPLEKAIKHHDPNCGDVWFERTADIGHQRQGIDLILHEGDWGTPIDEKAQLHNVGKDIPSFAFELSYLKDGIVEAGWFMDPRKKAKAYMLCWPWAEVQGGPYTGVRALLVTRKAIMVCLEKFGFDRAELATRDECLRQNARYGRYRTKHRSISFFYSQQYAEQMINIVIKTDLLVKLAISELTVAINKEAGSMELRGNWVGKPISTRFSVGAE